MKNCLTLTSLEEESSDSMESELIIKDLLLILLRTALLLLPTSFFSLTRGFRVIIIFKIVDLISWF